MTNFIQKSSFIQTTAEDASLTVVAPGAGKYNCLTQVTVETSAAGDFTITSGSKVFKAAIGAGSGLVLDFQEPNQWIGAENTSIVIAMSAGSYTINARGFVHP